MSRLRFLRWASREMDGEPSTDLRLRVAPVSGFQQRDALSAILCREFLPHRHHNHACKPSFKVKPLENYKVSSSRRPHFTFENSTFITFPLYPIRAKLNSLRILTSFDPISRCISSPTPSWQSPSSPAVCCPPLSPRQHGRKSCMKPSRALSEAGNAWTHVQAPGNYAKIAPT